VIIVVSGPIGSGKSTLSRGVARELEARGQATAVIDLDLLYAMQAEVEHGSRSAPARWLAARHAAATLAESFIADGVAIVVIDGSFQTVEDRQDLRAAFTSRPDAIFVTLRVSYEEALRRAQLDPTRGRSRDPAFLGPYYRGVAAAMASVHDGDLVIDTEVHGKDDAVAAIVGHAFPSLA
jgi:predicted kinase